jgi:hypothetical protein
MIDRNKKPDPLEGAKKIAEREINNEANKDVFVIPQQHAVFCNSDLSTIQEFAAKSKHTVIVVKRDGKAISSEVVVDNNEDPKKESKKGKNK